MPVFGKTQRTRQCRLWLDARLDDDEWLTLVAWVDANAPYHDKFYNKRPSDGSQPKRDVVPRLAPPPAEKQ